MARVGKIYRAHSEKYLMFPSKCRYRGYEINHAILYSAGQDTS
jgi:predicted Zn-ribbon and HTH transcriptional regulator